MIKHIACVLIIGVAASSCERTTVQNENNRGAVVDSGKNERTAAKPSAKLAITGSTDTCFVDPCDNYELACLGPTLSAGWEPIQQSLGGSTFMGCLAGFGMDVVMQTWIETRDPEAWQNVLRSLGNVGCGVVSCFPPTDPIALSLKAACVCGQVGAAMIRCHALKQECEDHKVLVLPIKTWEYKCPFRPLVSACNPDGTPKIQEDITGECSNVVSRYKEDGNELSREEYGVCVTECSVYSFEGTKNCTGAPSADYPAPSPSLSPVMEP